MHSKYLEYGTLALQDWKRSLRSALVGLLYYQTRQVMYKSNMSVAKFMSPVSSFCV